MTSSARLVARVPINLGSRSYDILIGSGLIDAPSTWADLPQATTAAIVTDGNVAPLYAGRLKAALSTRYPKLMVIELPAGEAHKDWGTVNSIFDALLGSGCDRKALLFALGGGVVGDVAGFAAACYMRGIAYVQVPTTLLAQVDSAVGGKTAINHALGKNMIGAFHQPLKVVADIDTLCSLPKREVAAGLAEVIKYAPIADAGLLDWLEAHLGALLALDATALQTAIQRSCEIKASVVGGDEREQGPRAILNFGHTFGHAIETGLGHGHWLHGEAVGCGMVMAADLSVRLGLIESADSLRLKRIIAGAGLPVRGPSLGADRYLELMRMDKKAEGGAMRFVVLEGLGRAGVRAVPDQIVAEVIEANSAA
ncbi:MAG: 3-dehydroquinate synthase [Burkholderiales bacterium]|jgi:3-dehydroquinate synthase|nr:3-dehydroquinate synthase [Burkholderiales bacterium]